LTVTATESLDLVPARADTPELAEFRARVHAFLLEHADPLGAERPHDESVVVARAKAFQSALFDAGLAALTFPRDYGGGGLTAEHLRVFNEESANFELPSRQFMIGLGMCAPTLLEFGTEEQKRAYLPGLLRGDTVWCQLFSEPGAGSDVASLQTKATRDGDEWVVKGQKVWTSGAHYCDYGLLVARTNPDLPKHRGISMFVADMHAAGVDAVPLRQINGEAHFNEVFLDDVHLPAGALVGEVDDGWRVAVAMLANERVAIGAGGSGQQMGGDSFASLVSLARAAHATDDLIVRQELADVYCRERILGFLGMRIRSALQAGRAPGPEGSVAKLATAILGKLSADVGMGIAGARGQAWEIGDPNGGAQSESVLSAPMLGIAGGTSEIQRNIIGERVLGLPKEPSVDRDLQFRELKVGTQQS
jgi:alkylation response protein AidB-like acyl-CoA dehydrogenase